MSVADFLRHNRQTAFSFEVLPPIRGKSIERVYENIDRLMQFAPAYINITTHRTEQVYKEIEPGVYNSYTTQLRPGTVAIAAVLKSRYGVATVPHIICSGFSQQDVENQLIDLNYLGIEDLLILRGDREKGHNSFTTADNGHRHASDLCRQVENFNCGRMIDGTQTEMLQNRFSYGVAGYPEKHEEAMNAETDLQYLKEKVKLGAAYIVTQMFFDNAKFFSFVDRCRAEGIDVPIVPGIKPLTTLGQLAMIPKVFHIDFPEELSTELLKCKTDDDVKHVGIAWGIRQAAELKTQGVPSIHFYTVNAMASTEAIAKEVY